MSREAKSAVTTLTVGEPEDATLLLAMASAVDSFVVVAVDEVADSCTVTITPLVVVGVGFAVDFAPVEGAGEGARSVLAGAGLASLLVVGAFATVADAVVGGA